VKGDMIRSQNREVMQTKLSLITEKAKGDKKCRFKNIAYLLNKTNLRECFYMLKTGKAAGVDAVSIEEYEKNLEKNLDELVERMKRQAYKPQPVRRVYISKANGKKRPLGIPATEDKIVQMVIRRILESIYEADFLEQSHGFRPGRSCHTAISRLYKMIRKNPVNYIIDADIKGFFDNVNHEWMMRCLQERISDRNMLRIIKRFLKSGVMEEGKYSDTEKGTPQGGIISPILSNIYLHYVLDLWIEKVVKRDCDGYVEILRYADDFVICVRFKKNTKKIIGALKERLSKFGLELAEDKTRIIKFGKSVYNKAKKNGKKVDTFNFLGFTHYCDTDRNGKFKIGKKTDGKKLGAKVRDVSKWLKRVNNMLPIKEIWKTVSAKLRGHYQYYGVTGNYRSLNKFYYEVTKLLYKWLNRRSQRKSFSWDGFREYLNRYKLPTPKIYYNIYLETRRCSK
jgi:RNA-directed DNA polymerase